MMKRDEALEWLMRDGRFTDTTQASEAFAALNRTHGEMLDALDEIGRRLNDSAGGAMTPKSRASLRKLARSTASKARG